MRKYAKKDLNSVKAKYNANFKKLLLAVGTPRHAKYLRLERSLHRKEIRTQKALGLYISDLGEDYFQQFLKREKAWIQITNWLPQEKPLDFALQQFPPAVRKIKIRLHQHKWKKRQIKEHAVFVKKAYLRKPEKINTISLDNDTTM